MNFPTDFLFLYMNGHRKVCSLPLHRSRFKDIFLQLCQIHWRCAKTTFLNRFFAIQLMNLPLDIESYLKKIFPSYDLNSIFFIFYKHNWNILNKSQVYSSPKMFFLSLATCAKLEERDLHSLIDLFKSYRMVIYFSYIGENEEWFLKA